MSCDLRDVLWKGQFRNLTEPNILFQIPIDQGPLTLNFVPKTEFLLRVSFDLQIGLVFTDQLV